MQSIEYAPALKIKKSHFYDKDFLDMTIFS